MFRKLSHWLKRPTDSTPPERSLPDKVRELLAKAELEAALELLIEAGSNDAIALKARREEALEQYQQKLIDAETFQVTNSRIIYALLEMIEPAKAANPNMPEINTIKDATEEEYLHLPKHFTEEQCQQIRSYLLCNEYTEALKLASTFSQDGLLLFKRYEGAIRDLRLGLVLQKDYQRSVQQINYSLTSLVSREETQAPLYASQQAQLIQLMEKGQWSELLSRGGEWNDQMLLIFMQYNEVEVSFSKGLITKLSYDDAMARIQQQVEDLIKH